MKYGFPLLALIALSACSNEQEVDSGKPADHADYVVIGKSVNTRQEWSGEQKMLTVTPLTIATCFHLNVLMN